MSKSLITKQALARGLKTLATRVNFDKITVADITDECGLNRQTFYYHFEDKLDLLHWIYDNESFALTSDINLDNWNEKFRDMLKLIKNDKMFYMNTIKCSNDYFEEYLLDIFQKLFEKGIEDVGIPNKLEAEDKMLLARFFSHGLSGIVIEWALGGMTEDEDAFSEKLLQLAESSQRTMYLRYKNIQNQSGV